MTAQIGDGLTIDGEAAHLVCCPALPWYHPRLVKLTEDEALADKRNIVAFSTACWRKYVAHWRLEEDRLFLDSIIGIYRLDGDEPLFADWVTEELRVSQGKLLTYVHMGFGSVFEKELLLDVQLGLVVRRTKRDNRGKEHD